MPPDKHGGIFIFMQLAQEIKGQTEMARMVPVVDTMPADLLTPLAVYLKLSQEQKFSFLLESVAGGENLARYSFVGAGPEMVASGSDQEISIKTNDGTKFERRSMMAFLREHFSKNRSVDAAGLPTFVGGAIGYLGFGCSRWYEPTLRELQPSPDDAAFMFFSSIVAFDHARQEIKLITLADSDNAEHLRNATATNETLRGCLEEDRLVTPETALPAQASEVTSNLTKSEFETAVREVKELIAAGECYQVVLSQCFSRATNVHPVTIYRALRSLNPSPYMFLLNFDKKAVVGASPEMLVRCRGKELEYRPIAGTRPRGKSAEEDDALANDMRNDEKEVAEHVMLVDLGRNDLGRVCEFGSINVSELMSVEKYSHVQHLVSSIIGTLSADRDRFDALAACFPAGTVSGAPKVRAIEIIQKLEPTPRGIYAGAVGYFDYAGNMDTCIAIRTVVLENGVATVQAGAGIVADSVPEKEYEETLNKARAMLKAVEIAEKDIR